MRDMARLWNEYNAYWHEVSKKGDVPVYFFRFEDLLTEPRKVLLSIFEFLLGAESLEGTYIAHRVD